MATETRIRSWSYGLLAASVLPVLVGGLALVGWALEIGALKAVWTGFATMKPVTALAFILSGVALWLFTEPSRFGPRFPGARRWGCLAAGVVILFGLDSAIENALRVDFGIDELLFPQALLATHLEHPGRMSPATSWNFILIGAALLLLDCEPRKYFRPSDYLALLAGIVGLLAVAGYIHGPEGLYQSAPFSSMALHTALLFVIVAAGVFLLRPHRGLISVLTSDQPGGWLARRLLPITTGTPFVLGWLRTRGEAAGLYERDFGFAIFRVADVLILAVIVWLNARFLNRVGAGRDRSDREILVTAEKLRRANEELEAEIERRRAAQESLRLANESLEAKVVERTAKLVAANRELEAFSYSVSHDLRAPLRAIDGFSSLLLDRAGSKLDGEEKQFLDRISTASRRMGHLIEDMLKLSRLGRSELRQGPVNLSELGRQIVEDLRKTHPGRQVEVSIAPDLRVRGDEGLLRVVLENLLGNAWKFTGKKEAARIDLGRQENGHAPVYFVRDNGAGFDMAYADRLFGAFQRLHRLDEFEGNGIGLASVQRILHRHGGSIRAEAAPDQGATFFFQIPDAFDAGL